MNLFIEVEKDAAEWFEEDYWDNEYKIKHDIPDNDWNNRL